jgi:hypothetical protein
MITGAHAILYSRDADADRDFLRNVLKLSHIDVGHGWLIFALPPSEVAVHPTEGETSHELYLLCEDINAFVKEMSARGIACSPIENPRWGLVTNVTTPGGGKLGVYQPLHPRPEQIPVKTAARRSAAKKAPAKKAPTRKAGKAPKAGKAGKAKKTAKSAKSHRK